MLFQEYSLTLKLVFYLEQSQNEVDRESQQDRELFI